MKKAKLLLFLFLLINIYFYNYYLKNGEFVLTDYVVVNNSITSISLDKQNLTLTVGGSSKIKAIVYPTDASNKEIMWASNNKKIITVSTDGIVRAVGVGEASIIAVSKANYGVRAICKVKVTQTNNSSTNNHINVSSVGVTKKSVKLNKGSSASLGAIISPSNATNKAVSWLSSNPSIVSVSSTGVITAKSSGRAIITVMSSENKNLKDTCSVEVVDTNTGTTTNSKSNYIKIKFGASKLAVGKTTKMVVTINNTSSSTFLNSNIKVSLPSVITTTSKTTKKVNKLGVGKSTSLTLTIKAKKAVTLSSVQTSSLKNDGPMIENVLNNLVKEGSNSKKIAVTLKEISAPNNYGEAMISLLSDMNVYGKKINPKFAMITNGGYELYIPGKVVSDSQINKLAGAVDGMLIEDVFYGEDGTNKKTNSGDTSIMKKAFKSAQSKGLKTFDMDYCNKSSCKTKIKNNIKSLGPVYYIAPSKELDSLPSLESGRANKNDVTTLAKVKNFAAVLNPINKYSSKSSYLRAIKNSNYDLIFIDMYFDGKKLTKKDISSLKKKKNGGSRYICAYFSIGEAEDYRYYWKKSYASSQPIWMATENKAWKGNYKVLYWSSQWKKLLYGQSNSYFDQVLNLGFDGAYLDVIDAYEFFKDEYK